MFRNENEKSHFREIIDFGFASDQQISHQNWIFHIFIPSNLNECYKFFESKSTVMFSLLKSNKPLPIFQTYTVQWVFRIISFYGSEKHYSK